MIKSRITSGAKLNRASMDCRDESESVMRHTFRKFLAVLLLLAVGYTLAHEARTHACELYTRGRQFTDLNALSQRLLVTAAESLPGLLDELDMPLDVPGECPLTRAHG